MVIVDNAAYSFGYQIDNGIPIISYYNDANDRELLDLVDYLQFMNNYEDLPQINRKTLQLGKFKDFEQPEQIF